MRDAYRDSWERHIPSDRMVVNENRANMLECELDEIEPSLVDC